MVVGICSVGSLRDSLKLGTIMVCDDFWCPADLRPVYSDYRAHFMPGFNETLRKEILRIVREAGYFPLESGVYGNARGPRFETKSEIRMMSDYCDIVGMTAAHEASAFSEVGIPYAIISIVDNYANGVGQTQLTVELFHEAQKENLIKVENCVASLLAQLPKKTDLFPPPDVDLVAGSSEGAAAMPETPREVELIVTSRWLVPMKVGEEQTVLENHAIVVHEKKILDILPNELALSTYKATKIVRLQDNHVLTPGFVNAHTHLAMNFLRGYADDLPLDKWLNEQIWPVEGRMVSSEFVAAGAEAAMAELIRSGVTCFNDMYFFPESVANAAEKVGLRGSVAMLVFEFPSAYGANAADYIEKGLKLKQEWEKMERSDRVTFTLGPHAPYTVSDATFERIRDLSNELQCKVHLHLHETKAEVDASIAGDTTKSCKHLSSNLCSPVENLDNLGLLNDKLIAVHMTCLNEKEIKRVAEAGTAVVHCPISNMKLASGFCPISKLVNEGITVALGTDSAASNNALDFFSELKFAAVLAKGVSSDAAAIPAWKAFQIATYNGAKALGLDNKIGSLEVGKAADFIAINFSSIESQPLYNVLSHLVYSTDRNSVTDVWVDGTCLMSNRKLTTINEEAILESIKSWSQKVSNR